MSPSAPKRHRSIQAVVPRAATVLLAVALAACGNVSTAPEEDGGAGAGGATAGAGGTANDDAGGGAAGTTAGAPGGTTGGSAGGSVAGGAGSAMAGSSGNAGAAGSGGNSTGSGGSAPGGAGGGLAGSSGTTGSGGTGIQRPPQVETKNSSFNQPGITVTIRLWNNDALPLALSRVTLRYWYTADAAAPVAQTAICYSSSTGGCGTLEPITFTSIPPAPSGAADHYAEIRFKADAGYLAPSGTSSAEILIGWMKNDGTPFTQSNDWSATQSTDFVGATRIAIYVDGRRLAGNEP